MPPSDDPFYSRIPTLPNAELFNYIHSYSRYKVDAVHAALAEGPYLRIHVGLGSQRTRHLIDEALAVRPQPLRRLPQGVGQRRHGARFSPR